MFCFVHSTWIGHLGDKGFSCIEFELLQDLIQNDLYYFTSYGQSYKHLTIVNYDSRVVAAINFFLKIGQTRPLFVYFGSLHMTNIGQILQMINV